MSFIGPRPLLPRDLPDWVSERIAIRPGITGWAQVNGGQHLSAEEKVALDAWYVPQRRPPARSAHHRPHPEDDGPGEELERLEPEPARSKSAAASGSWS